MIRFNVALTNPWRYQPWRELWQRSYNLTKNKTVEAGLFFYQYELFSFTVDLRWFASDHAGPGLELNILGLTASVGLHDNRHWNYDSWTWENH